MHPIFFFYFGHFGTHFDLRYCCVARFCLAKYPAMSLPFDEDCEWPRQLLHGRTRFERTKKKQKIASGLLKTFESSRISIIRLGGFDWKS